MFGDVHDFLDDAELGKVNEPVGFLLPGLSVQDLVGSQHFAEAAEIVDQILLRNVLLQRANKDGPEN